MKPRIPQKILYVEDSNEDFVAVSKAFKRVGLNNDIQRMKTGDEALEYLLPQAAPAPASALPGIILLDLNLPGIDGREVLRALKESEITKHIPVIVLSTSSDERDIKSCYSDGANSYVSKPLEFDGFVNAITKLKGYWFEISIIPSEETVLDN